MSLRRARRLARWRRRYRALLERIRRTLHMTRRTFRYLRWGVWGLAAVLLLVYGLFPHITFEAEFLSDEVDAAIERTITHEVTIGSTRMNLLGDLVLRDVTIAARDGDNQPYLARSPRLVVSLTYRPLNRRKLVVDKVTAYQPEVRMAYYLDGTWNTQGLFTTGHHDTEHYRCDVEIVDGHYLLTDYHADTPVPWDCTEVDATLQVSAHDEFTLQFRGEAQAGGAPLTFRGDIYPQRDMVNITARVRNLPAARALPYLAQSGLRLGGGTLAGEAELFFRADGYLCRAEVQAAGTGGGWQAIDLPPGDAQLSVEYLSTGGALALRRLRLERSDVTLEANGTATSDGHDLHLRSGAFPLAWLPRVAGTAMPELRAAGTFAGTVHTQRTARSSALTVEADLAAAALAWEELLNKRPGTPLALTLAASGGADGRLRPDRVTATLGTGSVVLLPAADGAWGITFTRAPLATLQQLSPALRRALAEGELSARGTLDGRAQSGAGGSFDLELTATTLQCDRFVKPAGMTAKLAGTFQGAPAWKLTGRSWQLGQSSGRLELSRAGDGLLQVLVTANALHESDLRAVLPHLSAGPFGDVHWTDAASGNIACTSDSRSSVYAGRLAAAGAAVSIGDWLHKPAGMPFVIDFSLRRQGDITIVAKTTVQANNSVFSVIGESNEGRELADFTVSSERCSPADLRQLFVFWRERGDRLGAWDGMTSGVLRLTRSGETSDYVISLNLQQTAWEYEDVFRKARGQPASLQTDISVMPGRVLLRRSELHIAQSTLRASGSVIPSGDYRVDLTLMADIYTPEVNTYLLNLDQRRVVGYPATTLIDSLQDRDRRIDLEWQVQGTFAKPQFALEMNKAVSEALRNTIDNRFRSLGLLVEGTLRIGGRIIALPFNVLRIFTRDREAETRAVPAPQPEIRR